MSEKQVKDEMNKALNKIFDTEKIINFQFDIAQKAFLKGLELGMKIGKETNNDSNNSKGNN